MRAVLSCGFTCAGVVEQVIEMRKQKEHVMNEKHIMQEMSGHPFLLQLKTTFKDEVYLYMLLELCQGGELFLRLLEEQTLSEEATRFYAGNIVLALGALHAKVKASSTGSRAPMA